MWDSQQQLVYIPAFQLTCFDFDLSHLVLLPLDQFSFIYILCGSLTAEPVQDEGDVDVVDNVDSC